MGEGGQTEPKTLNRLNRKRELGTVFLLPLNVGVSLHGVVVSRVEGHGASCSLFCLFVMEEDDLGQGERGREEEEKLLRFYKGGKGREGQKKLGSVFGTEPFLSQHSSLTHSSPALTFYIYSFIYLFLE